MFNYFQLVITHSAVTEQGIVAGAVVGISRVALNYDDTGMCLLIVMARLKHVHVY